MREIELRLLLEIKQENIEQPVIFIIFHYLFLIFATEILQKKTE